VRSVNFRSINCTSGVIFFTKKVCDNHLAATPSASRPFSYSSIWYLPYSASCATKYLYCAQWVYLFIRRLIIMFTCRRQCRRGWGCSWRWRRPERSVITCTSLHPESTRYSRSTTAGPEVLLEQTGRRTTMWNSFTDDVTDLDLESRRKLYI